MLLTHFFSLLFLFGFLPGAIWLLICLHFNTNSSICRCPNCDTWVTAEVGESADEKAYGVAVESMEESQRIRFQKEIASTYRED